MPAIRDWSFSYHTNTLETTITVAVPDYRQNDLLLAILSTDSGTQTWSAAGWTLLFSQRNSANLAVMYRIASSSEPAEYTFTYTYAETANGAIISIEDVDTTTPIANYARANTTGARTTFPTTTATRNNSLIIYAWCHGSPGTAIASAIEGPVTQLISKDGAAHNDGFAWGFMASAGTTPAIVLSVSSPTFNGLKATIVINPPSTGATVIPTYCAADNSVYVDPIHGLTPYNTNSAFAGNALTYWSSPLAGRTLENARVQSREDYGINSYRTCGQMTGPTTTSSTWQGATKVLASANIVDVTGKNVLAHAMPYSPADIQTVDGVNLGRGIAFGMASSADNARVWHVHGNNTPWREKRVPVVINEANTSGVIDSRGTFNPASVQIFGFFTSGFLRSSDWIWTMIWILDTVVIAGGNVSRPVNITDIRVVAADGHERMSVIQQAANQLLVLQPLQFGDGGTNPIYLDLNNTAIEFPRQYDRASRQVYYCSVDNVAGITYYAGPNDTIKHRNSIISSPSRYHWRLHPSSSTSATYDFTGLIVIGAGTISLARAITISQLTINNYSTLDVSSATLNSCTIINVPSTNNSVTVNGTTTFNSCVIDVSGVAAGNYWVSTATPDKFSNCVFIGGGGHAIRITAAGTYTFSGNIFNNFGNNNTNTAAIFNDSGGTVTLNITNGGNTPTYRNGTGATTIINNAVNILVKCIDKNNNPLSGIRVYIEKASDKSQILNNTTNVNGEVSTSYNYTGDTLININIRRSSSGNTRYLPYNTTGTITTAGFNLTVVLYEDTIALP